jgi:hypothetical protein
MVVFITALPDSYQATEAREDMMDYSSRTRSLTPLAVYWIVPNRVSE